VRRREAINNPDTVFSCISDGMQQSHSKCPHLGGTQFSKAMDLKIQGIIDHGREKFTMYRVFPTVPGNSNMNIYTFLLQIEDWKKQKNCIFPETIFWQINGALKTQIKLFLRFANG
jgi:hypothetical protein